MAEKPKLSVEPYKGVRDFYPEDQQLLAYLMNTMREVAGRFGYEEYHASVLEPAELYKTKGAENEEIVNEQTYMFRDRGEREVVLRPEMTPTVARMVAAKRRELGFPLRLFSIPNLFRYERPQRGRLREHWQLNVDLFGSRSPLADVEIMQFAHDLLMAFGATEDDFLIRIGSRLFLDTVVQQYGLGELGAKTLRTLLDRRAKMPAEEFEEALATLGIPYDALSSAEVPAEVATIIEALQNLNIRNATYDAGIVRGFDYYTGVVFEIFDTHPENNRSLFGGGRYDNLLTLFGQEPIPAVGFGMGDVTIRDFLAVRDLLPSFIPATKVYIAVQSPDVGPYAVALANDIRAHGSNVAVDYGDRKLGDQITAAAKHQIPFLIVVGEREVREGVFTVRDLMSGAERALPRSRLGEFLAQTG